MHMLNKHTKTEGSEDSNDVVTAIKDNTIPTTSQPTQPTLNLPSTYSPINPTNTPTIPTNTSTTPTINLTTNPNSHEKTTTICHHFKRGACNYGDQCWKKQEPPVPICHHFQRGVCSYGALCWKRHEPPDHSQLTCPKCDVVFKNWDHLKHHMQNEHELD